MNFSMSRTFSRFFALMISAVFLVLFYQLLLVPVVGIVNYNLKEIALVERRLSKRHQVLAALEDTKDQLERLNSIKFDETPYLGGQTPAASEAELQLNVRHALKQVNGNILSMNVLPRGSINGFTRVSIKMKARLSTEQLPKLIYSIETMEPSVFIENILIRSDDHAMSNKHSAENSLFIEAKLNGYSLESSRL